ncbi:oligosaccharyl transferase, archaeosortase A system-associated [Chloroflexota bacterium]
MSGTGALIAIAVLFAITLLVHYYYLPVFFPAAKASKHVTRLFTGLILAELFALAFVFRAWLPYEHVFTGDMVTFTGVDVYHHMRLAELAAHNFPHLTGFDPYFTYLQGNEIGPVNALPWFIGAVAWVVGLGSPTTSQVYTVGAYIPAILGALTVIPVYVIARELFRKRIVGLLAATILALTAGEFLGRSILGYADQHVAEVFLTTFSMMFFILALKSARALELTLADVRARQWTRLKKPLLFSLVGGLCLAVYLYSWLGALLFVFILAAYLVVQFVIDHCRKEQSDYLVLVAVPYFLVALVLFVLSGSYTLYWLPVLLALVLPVGLYLVSRLLAARALPVYWYPLALLALGAAGFGLLYLVDSYLVGVMFKQFAILNPVGDPTLPTEEMKPILWPQGEFSWLASFGFSDVNMIYGIPLVFSINIAGMVAFVYFLFFTRYKRAELNLLIIWSFVILLATLGQRRFAYYIAINMALFTGIFIWQFLMLARYLTDRISGRIKWSHFRRLFNGSLESEEKEGDLKDEESKKYFETWYPFKYLAVGFALAVLLWGLFLPAGLSANATAVNVKYAPPSGWINALTWMQENTPEPFGDEAAYYELYESPAPGEVFAYPDTAYGVLTWWDYGYWVRNIAHRIPVANPSQDPVQIEKVARFLTAASEAEGSGIADDLGAGYVVIDYTTGFGKLYSVIEKAGKLERDYWDWYLLPAEEEGQYFTGRLYHSAYYESLGVRLFNFGGEAVTSEESNVIWWELRRVNTGQVFKTITRIKTFPSYDAALEFMQGEEGNCLIAGDNPYVSPVALPAVEDYELVYTSGDTQDLGAGIVVPQVRVFKYLGN